MLVVPYVSIPEIGENQPQSRRKLGMVYSFVSMCKNG
jgi:hypothetical protein